MSWIPAHPVWKRNERAGLNIIIYCPIEEPVGKPLQEAYNRVEADFKELGKEVC